MAWRPTTAFILSSATVVAGLLRSTFSRMPGGQHVRVHFEPDLERGRRIHVLLDDLVQAELVGPELLVTEGLEAKNALALGDLGGAAPRRRSRSVPLSAGIWTFVHDALGDGRPFRVLTVVDQWSRQSLLSRAKPTAP